VSPFLTNSNPRITQQDERQNDETARLKFLEGLTISTVRHFNVGKDLTSKLFGTSGVRGVANVDLTPILVAEIGLAIAEFSAAESVLVARDTRVSGLMFQDALISGLVSGGAHVKCLGVVPTPVLAFLTKKLCSDAGVMITASHNPPQYNGIKIFSRDGMAYDEQSQKKIERIMKQKRFKLIGWRNLREPQFISKSHMYTEMIWKSVRLHKRWKVVVDPGCGATHSIAPSILKGLGCKVTAINAQPDGFFPARSSDPSPQSLRFLGKVVRELGADAGLAYDSDGDRAAFIDEHGRFVNFDRALGAYARDVTKKKHSRTVVTNVEASTCIEKMVEAYGGKVVRTKVGDIYVSEAVKKQNAGFGGEPCGAWIHPQFHYCPDGILSSALLLKALDDEDKSLAEFVSDVPYYPVLRENVSCNDEAKSKIIEGIERSLKNSFPKYKDLSKVDGIRLSLENGWILVRPSGTEPLVRLTVEGQSLKEAREIMKKGMASVGRLAGKVG
jgi:phosphoglucosamine mutase